MNLFVISMSGMIPYKYSSFSNTLCMIRKQNFVFSHLSSEVRIGKDCYLLKPWQFDQIFIECIEHESFIHDALTIETCV